MASINLNELPYLTEGPTHGRSIPVSTYYDHESKRFSIYIPRDGKLFLIYPQGMHAGSYISKYAADPLDINFSLSELIFQRFSFRELFMKLSQIDQDLINAAAVLHKYFVLLKYSNENEDLLYMSMITTEIEYAITNFRSFYDNMHEMVCLLRKQLLPGSQSMPLSFAKIVENNDPADLERKYSLPKPLAEFYFSQKKSFLALKRLRDNIIHHGHTVETIFKFEDGFALRVNERPISELLGFKIWPENLQKPNHLGSLLGLYSFLVKGMLGAMEQLEISLRSLIDPLPNEIAQGNHIFLRTELGKHFYQLENYISTQWFDPVVVLDAFGKDRNQKR